MLKLLLLRRCVSSQKRTWKPWRDAGGSRNSARRGMKKDKHKMKGEEKIGRAQPECATQPQGQADEEVNGLVEDEDRE